MTRPLFVKKPPREFGGQGVQKSHNRMIPLVFGLPLFYNRRLPDHAGIDKTVDASALLFYQVGFDMISHIAVMWVLKPVNQSSLLILSGILIYL
jgi:hypothetical protein